MPQVEDFMDEVVAGHRRGLVLMVDSRDRRAAEDGIVRPTCVSYRPGTMDGAPVEMLLSMLRAGRSPAGLP